MITLGALRTNLAFLARKYPIDAESSVLISAMHELRRRGWATRDVTGGWIPTAAGLFALQEWGRVKP